MIFGAILAGGIGLRMNIADMPKQFLLLGDKPIIIHTLQKMLLCQKFDYVYIGTHKDWILYMEDLINKYIFDEDNKKRIVLVSGGKDRNETIMNIVNDIENRFGENENNIIVTHDAVRPFVTSRILNENIEIAEKYGACDTVVPAIDTIVVSNNKENISEIPNREFMYQGQTPQSFKISILKKLYNELSEDEKKILTDACKICVVKNYPVYLVNGEISNLKITTPSDYKIAQAMIGGNLID